MIERHRPQLADLLDLEPHPEGGWFRETWRSPLTFAPAGFSGDRASATCIYFLLGPGEESQWHRVRSAELWLWHGPGSLELIIGGTGETPDPEVSSVTLGLDVSASQVPHAVVPADAWQAAQPLTADPVLVSCVVSPGFDFADFTLAEESAAQR